MTTPDDGGRSTPAPSTPGSSADRSVGGRPDGVLIEVSALPRSFLCRVQVASPVTSNQNEAPDDQEAAAGQAPDPPSVETGLLLVYQRLGVDNCEHAGNIREGWRIHSTSSLTKRNVLRGFGGS